MNGFQHSLAMTEENDNHAFDNEEMGGWKEMEIPFEACGELSEMHKQDLQRTYEANWQDYAAETIATLKATTESATARIRDDKAKLDRQEVEILALRKVANDRDAKIIRLKENLVEANLEIDHQKERYNQLHNVILDMSKKTDMETDLRTGNSTIHNSLDAQAKEIADLKSDMHATLGMVKDMANMETKAEATKKWVQLMDKMDASRQDVTDSMARISTTIGADVAEVAQDVAILSGKVSETAHLETKVEATNKWVQVKEKMDASHQDVKEHMARIATDTKKHVDGKVKEVADHFVISSQSSRGCFSMMGHGWKLLPSLCLGSSAVKDSGPSDS
jgi:chromosome segregation ATPase